MRNTSIPAAVALVIAAASVAAEQQYINPQALFPEGANVTADGMVYVELTADRLMRTSQGVHNVLWQGQGCFPAGARPFQGGFLVACNGGGSVVRLGEDLAPIWTVEATTDGTALNQPNDIALDGTGGAWVTASGAPDPSQQPQGQVLHVSADGEARLVDDGLAYANGVAVSADGRRLLVAEMFASRILSYPIEDGDVLGEPSVWADMSMNSPNTVNELPPFPDGITFGPGGNLFVAVWGGQRIAVFSPEGAFLRDIPTPMLGTTNLSFDAGGAMLVTGVYDISMAPFPGAVYLITE